MATLNEPKYSYSFDKERGKGIIKRRRSKYLFWHQVVYPDDVDFNDYVDSYDLLRLELQPISDVEEYDPALKKEIDYFLENKKNARGYLRVCLYSHNEYLLEFFTEDKGIAYTRVGSDG